MLKLLKSSISCATAFFTRRFRTTTTLRSTSNYSQKNPNHWRRFTLKETSRLSIVLLFWPVASWVNVDLSFLSLPKSDNHGCRRRLLSCVSTGFKDQASIFRSWLLPGKPTSLLHPFLQSDQLSLIVSTCSSLFLHPVQKPAIWITSLFLILQPLVWFLTRPCLIPYQTQFFWLMVVAPDGSTSATSRRAESGCHIINESSLYRSVYEKNIYKSSSTHIETSDIINPIRHINLQRRGSLYKLVFIETYCPTPP